MEKKLKIVLQGIDNEESSIQEDVGEEMTHVKEVVTHLGPTNPAQKCHHSPQVALAQEVVHRIKPSIPILRDVI